MNIPKFDFNDVKYAEGEVTFEKAFDLWKKGKVGDVEELGIMPTPEHPRSFYGYRAEVKGTQKYIVFVSATNIDKADCTCYLGQNDFLCKHVLALALKVLYETGCLQKSESPSDLASVKKLVNDGLKKIKSYSGPSRIWVAYQRNLDIGVGIIMEAVSGLPITVENSKYLWSLVLKISKKLATSGIDDSDGTVGECVSFLVNQLIRFAKEKQELKSLINSFTDDTGLGFEDDLREGMQSMK